MLFNEPYYLRINEARWSAAEHILDRIEGLRTCLDVGCGPGWFASRLSERGLVTIGIDGRQSLVDEARRRVPAALFTRADVCDKHAMEALPTVDLVFCFGLLYHLEDPVAAVRSIVRLGAFVLIETQIAPYEGATLQLVAEGQNETQGLGYLALIPSRAALIHLLFKSGATSVHRYVGDIDHEDFQDTADRRHRREIFLVAPAAMSFTDFIAEAMPPAPKLDLSIQAATDTPIKPSRTVQDRNTN